MQVFITGVSKGLGKALAEHYLSKGTNVIGIGRSGTLSHPNFSFITCDLENPSLIEKLKLPEFQSEVILINNAGIIGVGKRISEQLENDIIPVITTNTISPMLLCGKFLSEVPEKTSLTIVNISSGAAKRPIPSWASYCASKAALDLFSETIYLEEQERGRDTKVYSISPGVINTAMQEKIRSFPEDSFSSVNIFKELKQSGQLQSPEETARKIATLLKLPYTGKVCYSLKD